MKRIKIILLLLILAIAASATGVFTALAQTGQDQPVKTYSYADSFGLKPTVSIYARTAGGAPTVLYVTGHRNERIGRVDDQTLITEYLDQGYHVVVADYNNDQRAVSPFLDQCVFELRSTLETSADGVHGTAFAGTEYYASLYELYVVPAGSRLKRNIVYWEIDKHGSLGTKEKIMDWWNQFVAGKEEFGNKPVIYSPDQMTRPDGSPLDYRLMMDIIYPADPSRPTPVMMMQAANNPRNKTQSSDGRYHYLGFSLRGYTFVNYDHCYNPLALQENYGYNDKGYTLDDQNGVKSNTAAVRCVRAMAEQLGFYAQTIGAWGHSKASYGPAVLADPNNAEHEEYYTYKGFPDETYGPQPWQGYSSQIDASYQSMGNGTRRHAELVTKNNVPTIIACGDQDQYGAWEYWPDLKATYETLNVPHLAFGMLGLGHTYPIGFDPEMKLDRYAAIFDFFDIYLKFSPDVKPKLFYATPSDNSEILNAQTDITLHFAPSLSPDQVKNGVTIRKKGGEEITCSVTASERDTVFKFTPDKPLEYGAEYEIITEGIKDSEGHTIDKTVTTFTLVKDDAVRLEPENDATIGYGDLGGTGADKPVGGNVGTLALRWWSNGGNNNRQWNRKALMHFHMENISKITSAMLNFTVTGNINDSVFSIYGLIGDNIVFDENTVTWNNAPGHDPNSGGFLADSVYGGKALAEITIDGLKRYSVDVTQYLQSLEGDDATFLIIRNRSAKGNDNIISSEGAAEINSPDCAPYLMINPESDKPISSDNKILVSENAVSVYPGCTAEQLLQAITVGDGSGSAKVYLNGGELGGNQVISNGCTLVTRSQNGGFTSEYQIIVRTRVDIPVAAAGLVYNGKTQQGVPEGEGYTVQNGSATNAGSYSAVLSLSDKMTYEWATGELDDVTIGWNITKVMVNPEEINLTFEDGTFLYDGTAKQITVSGALPRGVTVEYENNDQTEAGVYTVTARLVIADDANFEATGELPVFTAKLTITAAAGNCAGCGTIGPASTWLFTGGLLSLLAVTLFIERRRLYR